jgi:tetratricopeptide (TPR) repeat protein
MAARGEESAPGRQGDVAYLLDRCAAAEATRHGGVIILRGPEGSGQASILSATARALGERRPRPTVVSGQFRQQSFSPTAAPPGPMRSVVDLVSALVGAGSVASPVAAVLAAVLSASHAAATLAARLVREEQRNLLVVVPRLLRAAAEERLTVCLIDQGDEAAEGWWADVVLGLAQEATTELPLVLAIAMSEGEGAQGEPGLYMPRRLFDRGLADLRPIAPATPADVASWIGPVTPRVADALVAVSEGRSEWVADLWADWVRREVVAKPGAVLPDREDTWDLVPGKEQQALAPAKELVWARVRECLGSHVSQSELDAAVALLAVAALEGRRFAADAVADALQRDRNDVIDLLDAGLSGDGQTAGIVAEIASRHIVDESGERDLWIYDFAVRLDWLTIRRYGLTADERRDYSLLLAVALESAYGADSVGVASVLARLFMEGGEPDRASYYERAANIGVDDDITLWRADRLLEAPRGDWTVEERALAAEAMMAAGAIARLSQPATYGITLAVAAYELAEADSARGEALLLQADFLRDLRDSAAALETATHALEIFEHLGDREGRANAHLGLGSIELLSGNSEKAQTHLELSLGLTEDPRTQSTIYFELAQVAGDDYELARAFLLRALPLQRATHDLQGEASSLAGLGFIAFEHEGDGASAREKYAEALEIARQVGDRHREGELRWRLATLKLIDRDFEAARREFEAVIDSLAAIEDYLGEARARKDLGSLLAICGDAASGRRELERALAVFEKHDDEEGVEQARERLTWIDAPEQAP